MKKLITLLFTALLACSISSAFAKSASDVNALVFSTPRTIAPFNLMDNHHHHFSNKNFANHWTFMFFGFTHCGYICPTTMAVLKKVYANLEKTDMANNVNVILVSIDPKRDSIKRLNHYVTGFNKNFIGLTGKPEAIKAMTKKLGIMAMKVPGKTGKAHDYDITHSGSILLVDPTGHLYALFSMPHKAESIISDFTTIKKNYNN